MSTMICTCYGNGGRPHGITSGGCIYMLRTPPPREDHRPAHAYYEHKPTSQVSPVCGANPTTARYAVGEDPITCLNCIQIIWERWPDVAQRLQLLRVKLGLGEEHATEGEGSDEEGSVTPAQGG